MVLKSLFDLENLNQSPLAPNYNTTSKTSTPQIYTPPNQASGGGGGSSWGNTTPASASSSVLYAPPNKSQPVINSGTSDQGSDLAAYMAKVAKQTLSSTPAPTIQNSDTSLSGDGFKILGGGNSNVEGTKNNNSDNFLEDLYKKYGGNYGNTNAGSRTITDDPNNVGGYVGADGNTYSKNGQLLTYGNKYGYTQNQGGDNLKDFGLDSGSIMAALEQEKQAIKAKYDVLRRDAETKTENERKSTVSGLYSLGEVNPLSSGVGSIGTASEDILNKRKDALTASEAEETSNAVNAAFGRAQTSYEDARQKRLDDEKRIQDQLTMEQTARENNVTNIRNAMALVASGKQLEQTDKDNAWNSISDLLTTFGSSVFQGADEKILAQMETAAGIPKGSLAKGLKTLKEQELTGQKTEIIKGDDGAIYSYVTDAKGEGTFKKLISGSGNGLSASQINTTVNQIAGAFDNEPIVKNYNTALEGYNTVSSIGTQTKSPADDIAFIYAFAKIMDPNSVVREGEYNTIQRYAQTWADTFGFSVKRIFSNTNFLTPDAKQKMLSALEPKINTLANQYQSLQSEYQRQIDDAYAGKPRQITNYQTGNTPGTSSNFDVSSSDWADLNNL